MGVFEMIVLVVLITVIGDAIGKWGRGRDRKPRAAPPPEREELASLHAEMRALSERMDRLTEEQRFLTELLEERPRIPERGTSKEAS